MPQDHHHEPKSLLEEEQDALGRILHAMHMYSRDAEWEVARWVRNFEKLSPAHKKLVHNHTSKVQAAQQGIIRNQQFLASVAHNFHEPTLMEGALKAVHLRLKNRVPPSPADMDKVRYVLKNASRDWSTEGAAERSQSYGRLCDEVVKRFPPDQHKPCRILVPGCGLGRLPFMLAKMGYQAEGNEYSYYMLLTSSYILNHSEEREQWRICPWLHSNCNQLSDADQTRSVGIPDVSMRDAAPAPGLLSMSAGDFLEVYRRSEYTGVFDCVVTCFFLDCAHNVIDFVETIHTILKEGGVWINLGPLLYHWADAHTYLPQEEMSIELSLEDVERIVRQQGFKTLHRSMVQASFNTNMRSMVQNSYRCVFWTVQKGNTGNT